VHSHIKKLYAIACKPERYIVGLMSGTSLDGLDVALCKISGEGLATGSGDGTHVTLLKFKTVPYETEYRTRIKAVFSKRDIDLQHLTLLNPWVGTLHGKMVLDCLSEWGYPADTIDVIASHGQTIYHCPKYLHSDPSFGNATLQIGDGDHMAHQTNIITLSDFRQKHIAAGGEGAPLAVYGDFLIFSSSKENRILLNIGGIANLTYLPKTLHASDVFSSDIGTGNTMMDAYIQQHFQGLSYDENSQIALSGTINTALLEALKEHDFFERPMPKTIGPELFNLHYLATAQAKSNALGLAHADVLATLNRFSADMIVHAIRTVETKLGTYEIYASGGGIYNSLLMKTIQAQLQTQTIKNTDILGINPDAKEAVLFAVIANECLVGQQQPFGNIEEGIPSISMGKISFYD